MAPSGTAPIPLPTATPPAPTIQKAGDTGDRTLWVVCVIMVISSLAFYVMAYRTPANKRFFHTITAFITTFAAISYYSMAVGDGISIRTSTYVEKHHGRIPDLTLTVQREVYWARYVDWALTTPLLLVDLSLLAGLNGADITVAVVADVIMVLTGLFAALSDDGRPRWGYYAIGCLAYLVVVWQLAVGGRATVAKKDNKTATFFYAIAGFTFILWTIYPIIWGVADGSYTIDVDAEIVSYAILDVLAKPVFGFWLLFTHDSMAESTFSIGGFWSDGLGSGEGALRVGDDDGA